MTLKRVRKLRRELLLEVMRDYKLKNKDVAHLLGITKPAVSLWITDDRCISSSHAKCLHLIKTYGPEILNFNNEGDLNETVSSVGSSDLPSSRRL